MKRAFVIVAMMVLSTGIAQERPIVRARVEPDSIMIGDRFDYIIEVEKDQVQVVLFPELENQDQAMLELVESMPVDTIERNGRAQKLRKRYRLAAFQEGVITLGAPRVLYLDKNRRDTLTSNDSPVITVATFDIDSLSPSIFDIKTQKNLPFIVGEITGYLTWGLMALALLIILLYIAKRLLARRGRSLSDIFKSTPPPPPHVAAIKALEALHNQKLWQNNRHKQYYSGLTDILRTYIDGRFDIGAMEMTSDEIIVAMRTIEEVSQKSLMDLSSILQSADLVKFAKATPEAEQNEGDYLKAYYFVEETKPVDQTEGEPDAMNINTEK